MGEGAQEHSTQEESHYEWPMKDKRILFVVGKLTGGGAERVLSILSNELSRQGYTIGVLIEASDGNEYPLLDTVAVMRLPAFSLRSRNPFKEAHRQAKKMRARIKLMRSYAPDIIIPFLGGVREPAFIANQWIHAKFVLAIRVYLPSKKRNLQRCFYNHIARRCNAIFLQNEQQKTLLSIKQQAKSFIVPNPIDEHLIANEPHVTAKVRNIVHIGRLRSQKNQPMLLRAFSRVVERYPDAHLNIYGNDDGMQAELSALIDILGLRGRAELCGWAQNIQAIYAEHDLFVLCSHYEGMPNTLMEAMASGLPVISTDCPTGPSELINDHITGLLTPVGDEDQLTEAILTLLGNPELANRLAMAGWNFVCNHYRAESVASLFMNRLMKTLYPLDV